MVSVGGSAPSVSRQYTYGADLISQRQLIGSNWVTSFYQYDGHGSVRGLLDSTGTLTDSYEYDAFGILINQVGNTPNNYLYAGEQWDADLGFYYLRARYLNAGSGRFWTQDKYEGGRFDPVSLHKYTFTGNDPVNKIDPSGRAELIDNLGATIVAGILSAFPIIVSHITSALIAASIVCAGTFAGTTVAQNVFGVDPHVPICNGFQLFYHRLASSSQTLDTAKLQLRSMEIWGGIRQGGYTELVQAYRGKLGIGEDGVEFISLVPEPKYSFHPTYIDWRLGDPGVFLRILPNPDGNGPDETYAAIPVIITRISYPGFKYP